MLQTLSRLFSRCRRSTPDVRHPRRSLLGVECLEDRLVPASFNVTTFADVVDPNDGQLSLREAISQANATGAPDTIVIKSGVYRLSLAGAGENANLSGDLDIISPLTLVGRGATSTAIDGGKLDRVFDVFNSINVTFSGLTVRNGSTSLKGGGIQSVTANLRLENCALSDNSAAQTGGGLHADGGTVTLVNTVVNRNAAQGNGGGINVGPGNQLTLLRSAVRHNLSSTSGGGISGFNVTATKSNVNNNSAVNGLGGGIVANVLTLNGSTVSGNSATDEGGGIYASFPTVTNSTISNNASRSSGGGISVFNDGTFLNSTISNNTAFVNGGGINGSDAALTNCTVNGNNAFQHGGGIALNFGALTNVTVSGNNAGQLGGGLYLGRGSVLNCTVTLNGAVNSGGGIHSFGGGILNIKNTIVAQNLVSFTGSNRDVSGTFTSQGFNLLGDGSGGIGFGGNDQFGTASNPIDARLAPLASNGGRTRTHALLPGSRAIDRGDNADAPLTDQRGLSRPRDGDGNGSSIIDIGAFER